MASLDPISAIANAVGGIFSAGFGFGATKKRAEADVQMSQAALQAAMYGTDGAILDSIIKDSDTRNYTAIAVFAAFFLIVLVIVYFIFKS